jgi:AbrB family looped-hinge helix DNA binding protein
MIGGDFFKLPLMNGNGINNGMKEMLIPIDQSGRIVLPKNVRDDLAVKSGDLFKVCIQGTSVTLTPSRQTAGFVRRGKALVFSTPGNELLSLETVNAALEEGRHELAVRNAGGLFRRKRMP